MNRLVERFWGRSVPVSPMRQLVIDYMWMTSRMPLVVVGRRISIPDVVEARGRQRRRAAWPAIFAKAFGMVAMEIPELRRVYLKWPWPHFVEYKYNIVNVLHEIEFEGEAGLLVMRCKRPERLPLPELSGVLLGNEDALFKASPYLRIALRVARYPMVIRRPLWWLCLAIPALRRDTLGTFVVTSAGQSGAMLEAGRSPECTLTYGPIGHDGSVEVRLFFDHRVFDGGLAARALARLEDMLRTTILAELHEGADRPAPAAAVAARQG